MPDPLILASASPRRTELLRQIGIPHEIVKSQRPELTPSDGQRPDVYVRRSAVEKLLDVLSRHPGRIILSADTIVLLDRCIMGKPANEHDADEMLRRLSGHTHQVMTAIALYHPTISVDTPWIGMETTDVRFYPLESEVIRWYLDTGEWTDKAGAYGIQGYGAALVQSITGCYSNVVGLPISRVIRMLHRADPRFWP